MTETQTTTQCPFCAETIQAAAVVCRFCGRDLAAKSVVAPRQRRNPIGYIIITLVVLGALGWVLGLFGRPTTPRGVFPAGPASSYRIIYRVGGKATQADLTYQNAQGGTQQVKVRIPWTTTFTASTGAFLYVSAQNAGEFGSISCEILVNNIVVKTSTSEGAYKIASCSGKL